MIESHGSMRVKNKPQSHSKLPRIGCRQVVKIIQHFRETGEVPPPAYACNRTTHPQDIPYSQITKRDRI